MLTADKIIEQKISPYDDFKKKRSIKHIPHASKPTSATRGEMIVGTQKKVSPRIEIAKKSKNHEFLDSDKFLPDLTPNQKYNHLVQASMLDQTLDK